MDTAEKQTDADVDPYLTHLLAAAPADVTARLNHLGDVVLNADTFDTMRKRQLREPGQPSESVEHLDLVVPSTEGTHHIPIRLHREKDSASPRPCLLSIHGGGYVIGSHLGDDGRFDRWAKDLDCIGVSVGYRLAPEVPYPGPLEDCYSVLRWIYDRGPELGVDPHRIGVIGGSAGGGLAAGLALLARDRQEVPLLLQALNYPMLDDQLSTRSSRAGAPLWGPESNQFGWNAYLASFRVNDESVPGYAVPSRATDLSGLPQAFVAVGNLDGLLDEDIDYAHRLIQAGVPTDLHVYADGPHAFDSMLPDSAVAQRASRVFDDWLRDRLRPRMA